MTPNVHAVFVRQESQGGQDDAECHDQSIAESNGPKYEGHGYDAQAPEQKDKRHTKGVSTKTTINGDDIAAKDGNHANNQLLLK